MRKLAAQKRTWLALATAALVAGLVAGIIAWGFNPLVNLTGDRLSALNALGLTVAALGIYAVPVLALASFGVFLSVVTRNSVAAVAGTLLGRNRRVGIRVRWRSGGSGYARDGSVPARVRTTSVSTGCPSH